MSPQRTPAAGVPDADPVLAAPVVALGRSGPVVPAWTLRAAVVASGVALMGVLAAVGTPGVLIGILGLLVALSGMSPASAAPAAAIGTTALGFVLVSPGDPLVGLPVLGAVLAGHVLHVAAGLAGAIPPAARLHLTALRRPLVRLALIQGVVVAIAAVVWLLPARRNPVPLEIAAAVVVAVLAAVPVYLVLRRR